MTYTLEPRDPNQPFAPYVWNLNPLTLEKTVGDVSLIQEAPQSLAVSIQNQTYYVNLPALAQGQGKPVLLAHLSGDEGKCNKVLAAISELQDEYRKKTRFTQVKLIFPNLMSANVGTLEVTLNNGVDNETIQDEFRKKVIYSKLATFAQTKDRRRLRISTQSYGDISALTCDLVKEQRDTFGGVMEYLAICRVATLTRQFNFSYLKNTPSGFDWFTQNLDALSPKGFEWYLRELRKIKGHKIKMPSVQFVNIPLSPRAEQFIDYLKKYSSAWKLQHAKPKKSRALKNYLDFMEPLVIAMMAVAILPAIPLVAILKTLAWLVSRNAIQDGPRSSYIPGIYAKMLDMDLIYHQRTYSKYAIIFDLPALIILNLVSLLTLPIVALPWLLFKIPEWINDFRGKKRLLQESKTRLADLVAHHPLFENSQKITSFRTLSKGLQNLTDICTKRGSSTSAAEVKAELSDIPRANPGKFQFFPKLPRHLQEKIIDQAIDNALTTPGPR